MTLPGGYTLDSTCANIVDNVYLGSNPEPVPSLRPIGLAGLALLLLPGGIWEAGCRSRLAKANGRSV